MMQHTAHDESFVERWGAAIKSMALAASDPSSSESISKSLEYLHRITTDAGTPSQWLMRISKQQFVSFGRALVEQSSEFAAILASRNFPAVATDSETFSIHQCVETWLCDFAAVLQQHILCQVNGDEVDDELALSDIERLALDLYNAWHSAQLFDLLQEGPTRSLSGLLLQALVWHRKPRCLELFAIAIVQQPPREWFNAALAVSPLMRPGQWQVDCVFPKLCEAIAYPSTASIVLDLANYCIRSKLVTRHPADAMQPMLIRALGGIVTRLAKAEEDPTVLGETPKEIQNTLQDCVALATSLCDTLGMLQTKDAIGKLHQAMELEHRRIQTEAAAALARMNEDVGIKALVALAKEPVARLRVLRYAEELGFVDQIDESYTHPQAIAESQLVTWLAEPQNFGLPPHDVELVDSRMLAWPSYDAPQQCFLFRFTYRFPTRSSDGYETENVELSNIGIAGPLAYSYACDLADLPIADIYAMFAGWQAEHQEIYEVAAAGWNSAQRRTAAELLRVLEEQGHEIVEALWLGFLLGDIAIAAKTDLHGAVGFAVTDGNELLWHPSGRRMRPLGAVEVYTLYKGRRILRSFNGSDAFENEEE